MLYFSEIFNEEYITEEADFNMLVKISELKNRTGVTLGLLMVAPSFLLFQ